VTYASPLTAVGEALYALFQDATLVGLLGTTGAVSDVPQDPRYPFLWFEVLEPQQFGGFGTKPGLGTLPELEIRLHAFSQFGGMAECQAILARAIALLADPPALSGYASWAIFHDATLPIGDEELNGVKVKELVSMHRLYAEAA
jgi:hypothetical protein